jgi:D-alanyl-D-alanine carboxypeptidase
MTEAPTRVHHVPHVPRRPLAWTAALIIVVAAATAALVKLDVFQNKTTPAPRPELQRILDAAATGPDRIAPGATAYVSGPKGTWVGSAGVANVKTSEPMPTDARMRLESVSKIYTATIIHQLARERKLSLTDTLEKWLPGMFPYGRQVTLTQLLTHRSGMVDDNVVTNRPAYYLSLIKDSKLRAQLLALKAAWAKNPALEFSPTIWVRVAAAVPPLFPPGTDYHYSNTGFEVLGMVATRATGKSMPTLYRERIFQPLGLHQTAWDPQGPISGKHPRAYQMNANGTLIDVTDVHGGKGAEGAVVSDATETARFLTALMTGKLLDSAELMVMENGGFWSPSGDPTGCAGPAYGHSGGGAGFKTNVWVSGDGSRVAVLLLNGRRDTRTDDQAGATMAKLYCAA